MRVTEAGAQRASERLESLPPVEILRQVHRTFGKRAAILSSMQKAGSVLCHMADAAGLDFDVVFVDTGVLHAETLATRDTIGATHRHLDMVTLSPERSLADQIRDEGLLYLSKEGQERCCDLRKSAPLRAIRGKYAAFVGGLRREEGGRRGKVPAVALDPEMEALRIHPLVAATADDLDRYLAEHPGAVKNPLHDMGFPSIGCYTCTTPVRPDEPERAGRWRHLADVTYCGINPTDRGDAAAIDLDDAYAPFFG